MAEPLREVAEESAGFRIDLLREQADVVRLRRHLLHRRPRLVDAAGPGERLDQPERAGDERTLRTLLAAVAVEQPAARIEILSDGVDHVREPLARRIEEVHPRAAKQAGVELAAAREHDEGAAGVGPALALEEVAHFARA